jgi:hypothetical protein
MVVGLMDGEKQVQAAIDDLLRQGFERKDISLVAPDVRSESERVLATTRKGLALGSLAGALFAVAAVVIPGLGAAVVAGPIAGLLAVPALGALVGGLVGALTSGGVPQKDAHFYAEGVRRGGVLLAVNVQGDERAAHAAEVLKRHGAADVQQRSADWARQGWDGRFHAA